MAEATVPAIHDLFSREIRPIQGWHEWLERWNAAATLQEMEGLLHCGFSVELGRRPWAPETKTEYEEADRLAFYFKIADGWNDSDLLRVGPMWNEPRYQMGYENGNQVIKRTSDLRQQLALKAFTMLCHNFFKVELYAPNNQPWRWNRLVMTDKVLDLVQEFFRIDKVHFERRLGVRNLPNHESKTPWKLYPLQFLREVALHIWGWEPRGTSYLKGEDKKKAEKENAARQKFLHQKKLWLLEVLSQSRDLLVIRRWSLELDDQCLGKLKEIALRTALEFRGKMRPVKTLEEACYAGSLTAQFLRDIELRRAVHQRLEEAYNAEQDLEAASRRLKELQG